mmetsp:Transcript_34306/g.103390  ORF Transcript_34306/g.103390 Transcript_34306/m.103390 type:complete len:240 (+) Transcript_34306:359-1078(+)
MALALVRYAVLAAAAAAGPVPTTLFADIGDGDAKNVSWGQSANGTWLLTMGQDVPVAWTLTTPLDPETWSASVDFSQSAKPKYPPVALKATIKQSTDNTMLVEWTDPSGTLNPDATYPLNLWTTTAASAPKSCPTFVETTFQDQHDGDTKNVSSAAGILALRQDGIWNTTASLDAACSATVDFSTTAKPDQPPVPLRVAVSVLTGADKASRVIMTWTDPSGSLAAAGYPLNIWEDVGTA